MSVTDLIQRLRMHPDNKTKQAMQRDGEQAADIIARLMAERDAARADERERCAKAAEEYLTRGRSPLGRAVADAIRAIGEPTLRQG